MYRLLSLDLSGNVGHARLERGVVPRFDTLVLEGPDLTFKCGQLLRFLYDEYEREPFDALAWERPLITPTDTVDLLELLYGLVGVCYAFIGMMREKGITIAWHEVDVPTAKKALTGKAKATKDEMLFAARRTAGWDVRTHHEADAGAVGVVADAAIWPKARAA